MTGTDHYVRQVGPAMVAAPMGRMLAWLRDRRFDLAVVGGYIAITLVLTSPLWRNPNGVAVTANAADHTFFKFVLANAAHSLAHLDNPLFATVLNTPHGVNMMANTSILGLAIPMAPVTLTLGPSVAFVLLTMIVMAATAISWYVVLGRYVVTSRIAAAVGAAFCAFGPGMMSQANAHPNLIAQFLVPIIVWRVARLPLSRNLLRDGIILGLVIAYQAFINEEILFLTAQALAICTVVYLVSRRSQAIAQWQPYLKGLAIAGGVTVVLLAYPLWFQFFGPQSYRGIPEKYAIGLGMDVASYVAFPPGSLFGGSADAARLAHNPTEQNSFFGWPLVIFLAIVVVWQWRRLAVRMAGLVALYFFAVSLGSYISVNDKPTGVVGPWRLLVEAPLFDSVVPARFALGATAAAGVLLALGIEALLRLRGDRRALILRAAGALLVLAALVPLTPHWINVQPARPTPRFFADGTWRDHLPADRSVLIGYTNRDGDLDGMSWSADTVMAFPVTRGYFLGPNPASPTRNAMLGSVSTPTSRLLARVAGNGQTPAITAKEREQAALDLKAGVVGLVVVPVGARNEDALRTTLDNLLQQQGALVQDVWVWTIRG